MFNKIGFINGTDHFDYVTIKTIIMNNYAAQIIIIVTD